MKSRWTKRFAFLICIFLFLFLVALGIYLALPKNAPAANNPKQSYQAVINVIDGTPQLSKADNLTVITDGQKLDVGDIVITDANSRAVIIFPDNSVATLDVNSKVTITALDYSDQNKTNLLQEGGAVFSRVEKILGKNTDYEVKTPTLIAAVRGTKFETMDKPGSAGVAVRAGTVKVKTIQPDQDETDVTINEEIMVKEGQVTKAPFDPADLTNDSWHQLITCIDKLVDTKLTGDRILYQLEDVAPDLRGCGAATDQPETQPTPNQPTPPPTTKPLPLPTLDYVHDAGVYTVKNELACDWSAKNATSYQISAGSKPGSTDLANWKTVTTTSYTFTSLRMISQNLYYCNVKALGAGGQSGIGSSDGIYYDNSSGYIINPPAGQAYQFYGSVAGNGYFTGMNMSDLDIVYYIKMAVRGKPTQYAYSIKDGGNWSTAFKSYTTPATGGKSSTDFNFNSGQIFYYGNAYNGARLNLTLKNSRTGKVLSNIEITMQSSTPLF